MQGETPQSRDRPVRPPPAHDKRDSPLLDTLKGAILVAQSPGNRGNVGLDGEPDSCKDLF
jgi:hypothetical protein